jgi:hypothetical protein
VVAQSIGGGGGLVGLPSDAVGIRGALSGSSAGSILASGDNGAGIVAMNLAGGGLRGGPLDMRETGRSGLGDVAVHVKYEAVVHSGRGCSSRCP